MKGRIVKKKLDQITNFYTVQIKTFGNILNLIKFFSYTMFIQVYCSVIVKNCMSIQTDFQPSWKI